MLKIDAGDSNVAIQITPVDASGVNIGLTGATNPVYVITRLDNSTFTLGARKIVTPTIDSGHTFFQYLTLGTEFTSVGYYTVQPQWTDASGGSRSAGVLLIAVGQRT